MVIAADQFVHLHLHTHYSLLDGGNRIDRLIARVKELGMSAVAVTDHGNLHGATEFYTAAKDAGIKPILGIEAYVAPGDRTDRQYTGVQDGGHHLVLLAENETGWRNLIKLSSDAFINGFYYKPRMDKTTLERWSDGIIAINGHLGSSLAGHLLEFAGSDNPKHYRDALEEARWHVNTFGRNAAGEPCFFVELQRHDTPEQESINPHLIRLARELDAPLVCDNDAHYLLEDDHDAHDTLCCISTGKLKTDDKRLQYSKQLYVKSAAQMAALFDGYEGTAGGEAVANTQRIAQRCNVELDFTANHAPVVMVERTVAAVTASQECEAASADAPVGSTRWFTTFCSTYNLLPFDETKDEHLTADELAGQCDQALRDLAEAGLIWRYGTSGITDDHRARLDRELRIIADKRISAYFLIVWDFVNYARSQGIPASARGSGVGTMVGYALGLSNACPLRYGLLFERFTDPDRADYPDIDIDMCQVGRQQVIDYVRQKYGHVAQIITFGTLKARAAIRDVGRVLNVPLADVDKLCKLVGDGLGMTLDDALNREPELRKTYDENPLHRETLDTARRLEGLARHAGIHAAGVVMATQPLDNIVPLYRPPGTDQIVTQWDGPTCEKVGLLKMDFLGLKNLSAIERTKRLIRESLDEQTVWDTVNSVKTNEPCEVANGIDKIGNRESGIANQLDPLDLDRLSFDDQTVLDLFRRGETANVFQFESGGMRNVLLGMKPDAIEDLIAANALYRPGPMELIPDYNNRKHGLKPAPTVHPIVDKHTADTHGIMVYQEQVMQIVHELGDIPLGTAYSLIKAISKKKKDVIDAMRPRFLDGAESQGLSRNDAEQLFDLIVKFGGYGFNKSHSTGYAIIAYQTAYLKTYFPVQYMAAVMTYDSVSTDKVVAAIDECRRVRLPSGDRGINVRPPDINESGVAFSVVFDDDEPRDANHGHIRFGLSAVKGVGDKAIHAIIDARTRTDEQTGEQTDEPANELHGAAAHEPFMSLHDFCERVSLTAVNRATIEALIKCGAFDSVHGIDQRASMVEALDGAIQAGQRAQADRAAGQMILFHADASESVSGAAVPAATLPAITPWSESDTLKHEKSVLGFYLSSHPLDAYRDVIDQFAGATIAAITGLAADSPVVIPGMITHVRITVTRAKKEKMAILTIEDLTGPIEAVVFPPAYATYFPHLEVDRIVFLKGKVGRRREEPCIVVDQVIPIEKACEELTEQVRIILRAKNGAAGQVTHGNGTENSMASDLQKLRTLLNQQHATRGNGNGASNSTAQVLIEVHEAGQVATLRVNNLRIAVDSTLPQRIAAMLNDRTECCQLRGPPGVNPRARQHNASVSQPETLPVDKASSDGDVKMCASIDRY